MKLANTVLLPHPQRGWEVWRIDSSKVARDSKVVSAPSEAGLNGHPVTVGLPSQLCPTFPLWLPTSDAQLVPDLILAELERRGLAREKEAPPPHRWQLVPAKSDQSLVTIDVMAEEMEEEFASMTVNGFAPAQRIAALPDSAVYLTEEQDSLVLVAARQGQILHTLVLGPRSSLDESHAAQIRPALLALVEEDFIEMPSSLPLVGAFTAEESAALEQALRLPCPVRPASGPTPSVPLVPGPGMNEEKFLPSSVVKARRGVVLRRRFALVSVLVMLIMAGLGYAGWQQLQKIEKQAARAEEESEELTPIAKAISQQAKQWQALAPVLDPAYYPAVQLTEISQLMPKQGMMMDKFESRPDLIQFKGKARSTEMVFELVKALSESPKLGKWKWNAENPKIDPTNKSATFVISGKPPKA